MAATKTYQFKLVLLGDASVGKSSIVIRFVKGQFSEYQESTIGAAFLTQTVSVQACTVKFEIWDTAGQEKYHSLAPMYYRGAAAAIVVYDITNQQSFHRAKSWVKELQRQGSPDVVIALAGNKIDTEEQREVATGDAKQYADDNSLYFIETSAKTNVNVTELFLAIARQLPKENNNDVNDHGFILEEDSYCHMHTMKKSGGFGLSLGGMFSSAASSKTTKNTIGFAVGGAKDVNNFRECIEKNIMPSVGSITYAGLLYQYYFDTTMTKHSVQKEKEENNSMLFYPSYCYAKIRKLQFDTDDDDKMTEYEYYMSVGLNSNINQDDFKRKHLNLIILLDKSGSMSDCFDFEVNTKMDVANESVVALLKHLTSNDRFGLITFASDAVICQNLMKVDEIDMDNLKNKVMEIYAGGGTNFERGYNKAIDSYKAIFNGEYKDNDSEYENRIIILTDAQPNEGHTQSTNLMNLVAKYAQNGIVDGNNDYQRIYTTFIGIGLDFNANLVDKISLSRGCNYYTVKSTKEFIEKMNDEFEYMVTPLVFNVCLKLHSEGNSFQIDKVYGSGNHESKRIIHDGIITKIDTLFPAKRSKDGGGTAGGIQLIKLKQIKHDNVALDIIVTFEDRNGNIFKNKQSIIFELPSLRINSLNGNNDMIEDDDDEKYENDKKINFYDNIGIRKAILLCTYTEIMINWIKAEDAHYNRNELKINKQCHQIFSKFLKHYKMEMEFCKDKTLNKEIKIMEKLIKLKPYSHYKTNYNQYDDNTSSDSCGCIIL